MSRGAMSVFIFSIYLCIMGFILVVTPGTLVKIFKFPEPDGLWIRIAGVLVLILALYYSHAARAEFRPFFTWTVIARSSVLLLFIAFVIADLAPPALILFGVIDFAAAMWTFFAMRSDSATFIG